MFGFYRLASAVPQVFSADAAADTNEIIQLKSNGLPAASIFYDSFLSFKYSSAAGLSSLSSKINFILYN